MKITVTKKALKKAIQVINAHQVKIEEFSDRGMMSADTAIVERAFELSHKAAFYVTRAQGAMGVYPNVNGMFSRDVNYARYHVDYVVQNAVALDKLMVEYGLPSLVDNLSGVLIVD